MIVLRAVHILFGVFWAGAVFVMVGYIGPAIGDVGPDGGKVMAALLKRKLFNAMPGAATLTILSGLWLYGRVGRGVGRAFFASHMGMTLGTGAVLSLVAWVIGLAIMRPSMMKAMALSQSLAQLPEAERGAVMAQVQQLRNRGAAAGRAVAVLLVAAVLTMAVARYV